MYRSWACWKEETISRNFRSQPIPIQRLEVLHFAILFHLSRNMDVISGFVFYTSQMTLVSFLLLLSHSSLCLRSRDRPVNPRTTEPLLSLTGRLVPWTLVRHGTGPELHVRCLNELVRSCVCMRPRKEMFQAGNHLRIVCKPV